MHTQTTVDMVAVETVAVETVGSADAKSAARPVRDIAKFMQDISAFLARSCVGGQAVTRAAVAEAGGLDETFAPMISHFLNAGFLPDYESVPGPRGGVVRSGQERPKVRTNSIANEFVSALNLTLTECVPLDGAATRGAIAKAMFQAKRLGDEIPGSEIETRISKCLASGLCPGFESKRAFGIVRTNASALEVGSESTDPDEATATTAPADAEGAASEPQAEAAPVETAPVETAPAEAAAEAVAASAENAEEGKSKKGAKKKKKPSKK